MKEICITKGRIAEDSSEFDNSDAEWFVSYEDYEILKKELDKQKEFRLAMQKYMDEQDDIILNQKDEIKKLRDLIYKNNIKVF